MLSDLKNVHYIQSTGQVEKKRASFYSTHSYNQSLKIILFRIEILIELFIFNDITFFLFSHFSL